MKKLLFIAFVLISSVSFISCSEDSEEITSESIIGKWQEKKVEGINEQFTYTFKTDGTGSMDVVDFASSNAAYHFTFSYTVDYSTRKLMIKWTSDISEADRNVVFTITDGSVLKFGESVLYKL